MKIVVLAGGTSTEREISIVSGSKVCEALRSKGHQAVLVDVFCGREDTDVDTIFTDPFDLEKEVAYMSSFNDQITKIQKERKSFFGPKVLELCNAADVVFLALHGACGEDGYGIDSGLPCETHRFLQSSHFSILPSDRSFLHLRLSVL